MTPKAFIFDLDMTLVDSAFLQMWRDSGNWNKVKANIDNIRAFPFENISAHELPAKLHSLGFKIGIVTSSPGWYARHVLEHFNVQYDELVAYEDTEQHKPNPEPITHLLEQLGIPANEAVYVGDSAEDVECGYNARVLTAGAGWGVSNFEEYSRTAPDLLFVKPDLLLKPEHFEKRGYLSEVLIKGVKPKPHGGSYLLCGDAPVRYALGRYFNKKDLRCAGDLLTSSLLDYKEDDESVPVFSMAVLIFLRTLDWFPDYVVSVPPKPSQEWDRFDPLLDELKRSLPDASAVVKNGLRCLKDIPDYKTKGPDERAKAVKGAYESTHKWNRKSILLIDDILTTKATSVECAKVLVASGAAEVRTLALAVDQHEFTKKICPDCGSLMKIRRNKTTGTDFWGCSGFAKGCKHTESILPGAV
jgi:HAD superfamily hydrolase (TIGR01549 family)